jgi:restriction system protein
VGDFNAAWMVRAGRNGEREDAAIADSLAIAGWMELGDLSEVKTRTELRSIVQQTYPARGNAVIGNWTGQLWRFMFRIQIGDLLVVPLKRRDQLAIGTVSGGYEYRASAAPGFRHVRPVKWLRTDVPRSAVERDLQSSMGSLLTVFGLKRYDAVRRIAHLAEFGTDPGRDQGDAAADAPASRDELLDRAANGESDPPALTIRELLNLWQAGRRTSGVVAMIEADLSDRGLTTDPPFTEGWIENVVRLVPIQTEPEPDELSGSTGHVERQPPTADELPPVSLRIGDLEAASQAVVSVTTADTLAAATTLMLTHDYSQLAVLDPAGAVRAVSWESIAKARLAKPDITLADATVIPRIVDHDADLLAQVDEIYRAGYVLVRGTDGVQITGIVTTADLTLQFASMARPVALIEEIERRLRRRVDESFSLDELRKHSKQPKKVHSAADLTLGAYKYLLKEDEDFGKLNWPLSRPHFLESLEKVRNIRNDLMHFSTDPLKAGDLQAIEGLINVLRTVDPRV